MPNTRSSRMRRPTASGISASIGAGGLPASSSLPISHTARMGTSTRPSPSMALTMVWSRRASMCVPPRPKRRRRARPTHHRMIVSAAQRPSDTSSGLPDFRVRKPSWLQLPMAPVSVFTEAMNCGPILCQTPGESGDGSRRRRVRSTSSPRSLVSRSSSWSARAITTSLCLTRLSAIVACSVSRSRSALRASVSGGASAPGFSSSGARSFFVSARSLRAKAAAAIAAVRTSVACSRKPSISTGNRSACSVRVAMRSSWRPQSSAS